MMAAIIVIGESGHEALRYRLAIESDIIISMLTITESVLTATDNINIFNFISEKDFKYKELIEKIKCFFHGWMSWLFYDLFIPKQKKDIRHDTTPYGFR